MGFILLSLEPVVLWVTLALRMRIIVLHGGLIPFCIALLHFDREHIGHRAHLVDGIRIILIMVIKLRC